MITTGYLRLSCGYHAEKQLEPLSLAEKIPMEYLGEIHFLNVEPKFTGLEDGFPITVKETRFQKTSTIKFDQVVEPYFFGYSTCFLLISGST